MFQIKAKKSILQFTLFILQQTQVIIFVTELQPIWKGFWENICN